MAVKIVKRFETSLDTYTIKSFIDRQGRKAYYAEEVQDLGDFWAIDYLEKALQHISGDLSDEDYQKYLDQY